MKIIYRAKKSLDNINNLFKFFIINMKLIYILSIIIIRIEKKPFKNIITTLPKNPHFDKIYK